VLGITVALVATLGTRALADDPDDGVSVVEVPDMQTDAKQPQPATESPPLVAANSGSNGDGSAVITDALPQRLSPDGEEHPEMPVVAQAQEHTGEQPATGEGQSDQVDQDEQPSGLSECAGDCSTQPPNPKDPTVAASRWWGRAFDRVVNWFRLPNRRETAALNEFSTLSRTQQIRYVAGGLDFAEQMIRRHQDQPVDLARLREGLVISLKAINEVMKPQMGEDTLGWAIADGMRSRAEGLLQRVDELRNPMSVVSSDLDTQTPGFSQVGDEQVPELPRTRATKQLPGLPGATATEQLPPLPETRATMQLPGLPGFTSSEQGSSVLHAQATPQQQAPRNLPDNLDEFAETTAQQAQYVATLAFGGPVLFRLVRDVLLGAGIAWDGVGGLLLKPRPQPVRVPTPTALPR